MEEGKEYFAFISYKREDEKWAKWLQRKLEHYHIPTNVRRSSPHLPKRIRPIFRDASDLTPGLLAENIHDALEKSQFLIVICSPNAAKSVWVGKEVQTFIDMGQTDKIIPLVIEGTPNSEDSESECFPTALLKLPKELELLGANINEMGRDAAAVKVISRMLGLKFDTLWQRYERERKKKRLVTIIISILIGLIGLWLAWFIDGKNKELKEQKYLLFQSKLYQDISLSKAYLSQGRTEMALVSMQEVNDNLDELDSVRLSDYNQLRQSLCDSILSSNAMLVSIQNTHASKEYNKKNEFRNNHIITFKNHLNKDSLMIESAYIKDQQFDITDTIDGDPSLVYTTNNNQSFLAVYSNEGEIGNGQDTICSKEKTGIRIYSTKTGQLVHFIDCWGWHYRDEPPTLALSNDGNLLLYREGKRSLDKVSLIDYSRGERVTLKTWYNENIDSINGSFSPSGEYFFINYPKSHVTDVYSAKSHSIIHSFQYEEYDSVYWENGNDISFSSCGKIYSWNIHSESYEKAFKVDSYAESATLSNDGRLVGAACNNGLVYVWSITNGSVVIKRDVMQAPKDVAFTNDSKFLWVMSGYSEVKRIDLTSKEVQGIGIFTDDLPSQPWDAHLTMTKDGKYCIAKCGIYNHYDIYDTRGTYLGGSHADYRIDNEKVKQIISEFVTRDVYDYEPEMSESNEPVITSKRYSSDGRQCIQAFSNGLIKIFSKTEMESLKNIVYKNI